MTVALVIGNSDGIGLATTNLLLAEGWRVIGVSRRSNNLIAPNYEHYVCDVSAADYGVRLARIVAELSELSVCVYCAGIGQALDLDDLSGERQVFETNLLGAVTTMQVVIPALLRAGRGQFIGLSSQGDRLIDPVAPSYVASKAGLTSYLECLALACRTRGVAVTNVRFGFVNTKLAKSPVRPFMISAVEAAQHVLKCIRKRPMRYTFPRRMALLLWFVRVVASMKRRLL